MSVTLADVLEHMASPVGTLLEAIPGAKGVGPIVGEALGLAADLIRDGADAQGTIARLRRSPELLAQVRAEKGWEGALDDKFPEADGSA